MQIKFITLNVEHGGILMDNIINFLDGEKPDVLFLQEVYNSKDNNLEPRFRTIEYFKEKLGSFLPFNNFVGLAFDPDIKADMGNAIFSKFPLSHFSNQFFDVDYKEVTFTGYHEPVNVPRALQCANADVNGVGISLFNLHGIWGTDGGDSDRRIAMAKEIAEIVAGQEKVIFAGDTNFTKDASKTIEIIESAGVKSIFGDSLVSTFNMRHKTNPGYATAAVDMIFTSNDIEVIEKEMPEVDVSDHYPLKAILKF